jgi:alanine racemase
MLNLILKSPYLKLEGVASHFATAESKDQSFLKKQLATYHQFWEEVKQIIPPNVIQHTACSAAITAAPESHLGLVRLGIALYGLWPSAENKKMVNKMHSNFELKPALTWKTQIVEVQMLPKGTPIGYGRSYITKRPTIMAVIPIGYWDGYDRKLSNSGEVIVRGTQVPIIGRICMNISMVDITKVPNTKVGDEVILIGKDSEAEITADEMAKKVGTINYEVITRINAQLPRILF